MSRRCSKPWWTPRVGGVIDGAGQRLDERHHVVHRHRPALAQHDVERIADGVLLREIRGAMLEPGGDRRGNVRMIDVRGDERVELGDERGGLFGREIETKDFDRDEPIATAPPARTRETPDPACPHQSDGEP